MDWKLLLCEERRKPSSRGSDGPRTELERDHDRILFSAPIRRLADKTQVFPLEKNDCVHTRLTHSHEVSNLARSFGINLAFNTKIFPSTLLPERNVPAILAAIGLAHDLGNPPFGHRGEASIQHWFLENKAKIFLDGQLEESLQSDFLKFEGNAQTLRILTRLQLINDDYGLNLTFGTLAALMKYSVGSPKCNKDSELVGERKPGFFESERSIVEEIWSKTGLREGLRHPLTYIMEASDDIAYSVIDIEDAVKKGLISYADVWAFMNEELGDDVLTKRVLEYSDKKHKSFRTTQISPEELNDISMQMFRVSAINEMTIAVMNKYQRSVSEILSGSFAGDLIGGSDCAPFCKALKAFAFRHAYQHKAVRKIELKGHNTINGLMDMLWKAITMRSDVENTGSSRTSPFAAYAYSRISENYRRIFEDPSNKMSTRYKEAQLLTDMISGMTDSYALALCEELVAYDK